MNVKRLTLLGTPVDQVNMAQTLELCAHYLTTNTCHHIVTTNPEAVVRAQTDATLKQTLWDAELVTADGVGIVWGVNKGADKLEGTVAGSDLLPAMFERFGSGIRVFYLGAKPGIAQRAALEVEQHYGSVAAGHQDGFFDNEDQVIDLINQSKADVLLVGMGERQDLFIHRNKHRLQVNIAIGVGGMLDVLSGEVKRAHPLARKLKIEWLVRVGLDRKRWGRFPRLLEFVQLISNQPK